MKLTPVSGPGAIQDYSTPEHVRTAKMLSAYNNAGQAPQPEPVKPQLPQKQEYAVPDANRVAPEDLSAIQQPAQTAETSDNNASTETTEQAAEAKPDPELESRFQKLARSERAFRAKIHQQNLELKKREEALKSREQALAQPSEVDLTQYIPKARVKEDALSVLEEAEVNWDELSQQAINRQPTDPRVVKTIRALEAKIASLEKGAETQVKTQQEQQQAQYQAAIKQIRADATSLINSDPEFETVKAMNAVKDVVELIEKTYEKDGVVLSVEEATREVENYLVDEAMKITQIQKVQKRLAESKAKTLKTDEKTQSVVQTQPAKTLTNAISGTKKLSMRDRAIARANGFKGDF